MKRSNSRDVDGNSGNHDNAWPCSTAPTCRSRAMHSGQCQAYRIGIKSTIWQSPFHPFRCRDSLSSRMVRTYPQVSNQTWQWKMDHFVGDYPIKTSIHRGFPSQPCLMKPEGKNPPMAPADVPGYCLKTFEGHYVAEQRKGTGKSFAPTPYVLHVVNVLRSIVTISYIIDAHVLCIYNWLINPNWLVFFRGIETTNQIIYTPYHAMHHLFVCGVNCPGLNEGFLRVPKCRYTLRFGTGEVAEILNHGQVGANKSNINISSLTDTSN